MASQDDQERECIGKTSSPIREPNSTNEFNFWIKPGQKVNPFDFFSADHMDGSKTVAVVDEMYSHTDADSHLTNFIGNEVGNPNAEPFTERVITMVAKAQVLRNVQVDETSEETYMPLPPDKKVFFATAEEVGSALGFDNIKGVGIPAGIIKQSNGDRIPVFMDSAFLLGPEAAHANASGISGLATKTSYLMFLITSLFQKMDTMSLIIFNVKGSDLLHIDEAATDLTEMDMEMYNALDLQATPFQNVSYFLPRGRGAIPDSDNPPQNFQTYAYSLADSYADLDLLLGQLPDQNVTIDPYCRWIAQNWNPATRNIIFPQRMIGRQTTTAGAAATWNDLITLNTDTVAAVIYNTIPHSTPPRVNRELRRLTDNRPLFVGSRGANEIYLGQAVRSNVQPGHISVIDIARQREETQAFIVGDVMRNLEELYQEVDNAQLPNLVIFIDELNKYAPDSTTMNSITEAIVEITSRGRYRRTALFGAEQFKSKVHKEVWGNCSLHAMGRGDSSELSSNAYGDLSKETKMNVMRLRQGEMVLHSKIWRAPIKVTYPRPPIRRPQQP